MEQKQEKEMDFIRRGDTPLSDATKKAISEHMDNVEHAPSAYDDLIIENKKEDDIFVGHLAKTNDDTLRDDRYVHRTTKGTDQLEVLQQMDIAEGLPAQQQAGQKAENEVHEMEKQLQLLQNAQAELEYQKDFVPTDEDDAAKMKIRRDKALSFGTLDEIKAHIAFLEDEIQAKQNMVIPPTQVGGFSQN